MTLLKKLLTLPAKAQNFLHETRNRQLIRSSGYFDEEWYLAHNPDVAEAKVDPVKHYLRYGGFEGRDPGPNFLSRFYLETYADINNVYINPLVHYLLYGKAEGRSAQPSYKCPVCSRQVNDFLPIGNYWAENRRKYGYPYTFDDLETMNAQQYICPSCGSSDRNRLYALYISKIMEQNSFPDGLTLLDIAPSKPLKTFFLKFDRIKYQSADKYMEEVDLAVDITDMRIVNSEAYDVFICSHVLEHVTDDKKALSELFRILKRGGLEEIDEDPTILDPETRWRRFGQFDHVRLYSKKGFLERIQEAGFVVKQYGVEYFGEDVFIECGISQKSVLYVVQKNIL